MRLHQARSNYFDNNFWLDFYGLHAMTAETLRQTLDLSCLHKKNAALSGLESQVYLVLASNVFKIIPRFFKRSIKIRALASGQTRGQGFQCSI